MILFCLNSHNFCLNLRHFSPFSLFLSLYWSISLIYEPFFLHLISNLLDLFGQFTSYFAYINFIFEKKPFLGVLETSCEDFESGDDVFEAIGGVLQEVTNDKTEEDIKKLCDQLMHALKPDLSNGSSKKDQRKILDAPVHLGSMVATNSTNFDDAGSLWIQKTEDNLVSNLH